MPNVPKFYSVTVPGELDKLRRLHGLLESDNIDSREEFKDVMKTAFVHCGLDYKELSGELGFSPSSVFRWVQGKSAPHHSLWPIISEWIIKSLKNKVDEMEPQIANAY